MEDGENDKDSLFDCEVHGVRKTLEKRPADPRPDELVLERSVGDTIVGCAKFIQELQPKTGPFILVPLECRLNVKIGAWR